MKRILSILATLCLFLKVGAQENISDKGVRIGQQVPDVLVTGAKGVVIGGREMNAFRLSALQGRLVILDFWATWCAPCRAMVPRMDSLQRMFGKQVLFLPVAYESEAVVAPILAAMRRQHPFDLPEVTGDKVLERLFPHRTLPHYVWIGGDGVVRAITEYTVVNAVNIHRLLDSASLHVEQKQDIAVPYDGQRPLLLGGNGGDGSSVRYHSLLSAYIPGLHGGLHISPWDSVRGQRITARNVPLTWLCRLAYGEHGRWFSNARIRVLSKDSLKIISGLSGQAYGRWMAAGNGYCYELLLPPELAGRTYPVMQEDLRRMFPQYSVSVRRERVRCLALVRTSAKDKLHTAGGVPDAEITPFKCHLRNASLGSLVNSLERQYMQRSVLPLADETGYREKVDLVLEAPMADLAGLNTALSRYDLQLEPRDAEVELLEIRDAADSLKL